MACAICETRKARRFCPGVGGEICTICCGTEREVSVTCPLDCPFLVEARRHDKPAPLDTEKLPNRDIRISEKFMDGHTELTMLLGEAVSAAAAESGAVDQDVIEALEALIRTYRTLESGMYYDTLPQGNVAVRVYRGIRDSIGQQRETEQRNYGALRTRDGDILTVLVFYQRLALMNQNGRPRCRAFLGGLSGLQEAAAESKPGASSLILP